MTIVDNTFVHIVNYPKPFQLVPLLSLRVALVRHPVITDSHNSARPADSTALEQYADIVLQHAGIDSAAMGRWIDSRLAVTLSLTFLPLSRYQFVYSFAARFVAVCKRLLRGPVILGIISLRCRCCL